MEKGEKGETNTLRRIGEEKGKRRSLLLQFFSVSPSISLSPL